LSTTRYSALSWLPKSLFFQFGRVNNIYFLLISILCFFPFSPKLPWSIISVFAGVLLFTTIKEGIEDLKRYRQDQQVNKAKILKFDFASAKLVETECQKLYVGDVKTSSAIYPEFFIQASAYAKGLEEMGLYKDFHGVVIVNVPKKGGLEVKENYDIDGNFNCFKACLTIIKQLDSIK
jgi:phospholipid-translocating ATPase